MFETYKNYGSPLAWMEGERFSIEQQWFMETYYPRYETIMAIARDLLNDRWMPHVPQYHRHGEATGSASFHVDTGERLHGVKAAAAEYGVDDKWVQKHVVGMLRGTADVSGTFKRSMRAAATAYGKDLCWQHPLMPGERILERCHDFVPAEWWGARDIPMLVYSWYTGTVRRKDLVLTTSERKAESLRVSKYRQLGWPETEIGEYIDGLCLQRERSGRYDGRGEVA